MYENKRLVLSLNQSYGNENANVESIMRKENVKNKLGSSFSRFSFIISISCAVFDPGAAHISKT